MQVRVFVIMEEGIIQNVLADDPDVVDVVVVDYAHDGTDPSDPDLTMVPQDDANGKVTGYEPAFVSRWGNEGLALPGQALYQKAVKMFGEGG